LPNVSFSILKSNKATHAIPVDVYLANIKPLLGISQSNSRYTMSLMASIDRTGFPRLATGWAVYITAASAHPIGTESEKADLLTGLTYFNKDIFHLLYAFLKV
jgi:hypothetical protein